MPATPRPSVRVVESNDHAQAADRKRVNIVVREAQHLTQTAPYREQTTICWFCAICCVRKATTSTPVLRARRTQHRSQSSYQQTRVGSPPATGYAPGQEMLTRTTTDKRHPPQVRQPVGHPTGYCAQNMLNLQAPGLLGFVSSGAQ